MDALRAASSNPEQARATALLDPGEARGRADPVCLECEAEVAGEEQDEQNDQDDSRR
jgi:hypothetical protein